MPPKLQPNPTESVLEAILDPKACEAIANALAPFLTKILSDIINNKFLELSTRVDALEAETSKLQGVVQEQARRIEGMEAYSRTDQLVIRGLPEVTYAERASASTTPGIGIQESVDAVEKAFIAFCGDKLNVTVDQRDISIIHRLKAGSRDSVRPVIVRFTNKKIRNIVYNAKKLLRGSGSNIYVSEHLTKLNSNLFFEARKLLKERKIYGCWTTGGIVHVKFSPDPGSRPTPIYSMTDLRLRP